MEDEGCCIDTMCDETQRDVTNLYPSVVDPTILPSSKVNLNPALRTNTSKQLVAFVLINVAATIVVAISTGDMADALAHFIYFTLLSVICLSGINTPYRWVLLSCYVTVLILASLRHYYKEDTLANNVILVVLLAASAILLILGLFVNFFVVILAVVFAALIWYWHV